MTNLKYLFVGALLVLAMNSATQAEVVDMSKFTCDQLLSGTPDAVEAAIWTSGYYNGLRKKTKIDLAVMKHNGSLVVAACKDNPKKTVMQTVNTLLGGEKMK